MAARHFAELAPAKVNLTLRVLGRRSDGYHELESLVAFAQFGDALTLQPGEKLDLRVDGPTAAQAGSATDNLVLRATRALAERVPDLTLGEFVLTKRLPAGAGLGGGSSDAAAALRLLAQANGLSATDPRLLEAAKATGADVPVCLDPRPRLMGGIGDRLSAPFALPPLAAVLVHPGLALATKDVFAALGLQPGDRLDHPVQERDALIAVLRQSGKEAGAALLDELRNQGNDLETPAIKTAPVVADVLAALRAVAGSRLARMSGSGSACFALFDTKRAATEAAQALGKQHPGWWICATVLGKKS
jgi:4-diphosphocytidyl-2-C-methyl-D-erythritol kinase